jgi:hypothetical protein
MEGDAALDRSSRTGGTADDLKFYILSVPETTSRLLGSTDKNGSSASAYYRRSLNEESAERWLHLGFAALPQRTLDPDEADVHVIVGYLHLYHGLHRRPRDQASRLWKRFVPLYRRRIVDRTKPHLILIPSWNPKVSRDVGIHALVNMLQEKGDAATTTSSSSSVQREPGRMIWSVGFERNSKWQHLPPGRIVPIPYVVNIDDKEHANLTGGPSRRIDDNSVFYAGDARNNAQAWAGCRRSEIVSAMRRQQIPPPGKGLQHTAVVAAAATTTTTNHTHTSHHQRIHVQLLGKRDRMEQATYHAHMRGSDWCLVLCGDTPSSRTLTSSMIFGCIPVRVGSRLRGLCEEPCHGGFGWDVTGPELTHLPYATMIDWDVFPEIDEAELLNSTNRDVLVRLFDRYGWEDKVRLRSIMRSVRTGWIYGWGDPVTSSKETLGDASRYIWKAFVDELQKEQAIQRSQQTKDDD